MYFLNVIIYYILLFECLYAIFDVFKLSNISRNLADATNMKLNLLNLN